MIEALDELVSNTGFRWGVLVGALIAVATAFGAARIATRRLGVAAGAIVVAAMVALEVADRRPQGYGALVFASTLLGIAGVVVVVLQLRARAWGLAFVPGAFVLAVAVYEQGGSTRAVLAAMAALAASWAWSFHRQSEWCAEPVLAVITLGGVYVCVPETSLAVVGFGAALPFVATGWPFRMLMNGSGAPAVFALVVWLAFVEGRARGGAIVGAIACLGLFVLQPAVVRRTGRDPSGLALPPELAVVIAHALLVLWCARIAGTQQSAISAAVLVALGVVVTIVTLRWVPRGARGDVAR